MKSFSNFATSIAILSAFTVQTQAQSITSVSFDNTYDIASSSLTAVACSDQLLLRFPTFGSLPPFPNIGGAQAITGFGSPNCGTCWQLTFNGTSINVLAIDAALNGFNIAKTAFDTLTHGQAEFIGRINAVATRVAVSACGL